MQPDQFSFAGEPSVHEATMLLQQFLQLSEGFSRHLGRELDVNATDYRAMEHLLRAGPLTPTEIAQRLSITGAAATTVVDRLVERGHVQREPDVADRRRIRVVPTASSAQRAAGLILPMISDLDAQLQEFTPEEQQAITTYLERIVTSLAAHAD